MKMAVFRVVTPCNLVEVYRRFVGGCCIDHQGIALMMEAAGTNYRLAVDCVFSSCLTQIPSPFL
jgi:hypothetical protein